MSEWVQKPIKALGRVITGKTPPKNKPEYYEGGNRLFVSPKDLGWDKFYVQDTETQITKRALQKFKNQVIPKNSILFTSLSFAFGKMGIASEDCLTNQQINTIIVNKHNNYRYIYYLLKAYRPIIFSYNSGIDTPIVPKSVFEKIEVKCPSLKVQDRVSAILSAYDDLIGINKRRIAMLEKMAEEIYREWFVRFRFPGWEKIEFSKGTPKHWDKFKFGSVCQFLKGKNPHQVSEEYMNSMDLYTNVDSILRGKELYATRQKSSIMCEVGDPLLLMDGSRSGLVFRAKQKGIVGSTLAVVKTSRELNNYIFEYLKASHEAIVFNNTGSAIPHANKEFIKRMLLVLPKDQSILKKFNKIYDTSYKMIGNLQKQIRYLKETKDQLLPRLISGKLSVENLDIQFPPSMQELENQPTTA